MFWYVRDRPGKAGAARPGEVRPGKACPGAAGFVKARQVRPGGARRCMVSCVKARQGIFYKRKCIDKVVIDNIFLGEVQW